MDDESKRRYDTYERGESEKEILSPSERLTKDAEKRRPAADRQVYESVTSIGTACGAGQSILFTTALRY